MEWGKEKISKRGEGDPEKALISDREIFKFTRVIVPGGTDIDHSGFGRTAMAPSKDLIDLFPIAFKKSLHGTVPTVFHPTRHS